MHAPAVAKWPGCVPVRAGALRAVLDRNWIHRAGCWAHVTEDGDVRLACGLPADAVVSAPPRTCQRRAVLLICERLTD
jgi:hypothetical protein